MGLLFIVRTKVGTHMLLTLAMFATFGIAAALTALLIPPVTRLCFRYNWLAHPNARRIHKVPIPTLGGIAMIAAFVITTIITFSYSQFTPLLERSSFESLRLMLMLVGALLVAVVSMIDDVRELPALPRLMVHILAALIAVGPYLWDHTLYTDIRGDPTEAQGIILTAFNFPFVHQIHLHNISPWLAIGATVFWIVGMMNMLNWVDGMDGLATGITLIAALVLAIHTFLLKQYTVMLLPLILAGVCAGFLPFNFNPAKIFMGDVGAMTLGYILAVSAIIGGAKLATALLVLAVPIIDMAWLILLRTLRGRSAAQAGRDHLHIRLLDLGFSQRQIVCAYYLLSAAFGVLALSPISAGAKLAALIVLGLIVLGVLVYVTFAEPQQKTQNASR